MRLIAAPDSICRCGAATSVVRASACRWVVIISNSGLLAISPQFLHTIADCSKIVSSARQPKLVSCTKSLLEQRLCECFQPAIVNDHPARSLTDLGGARIAS
jgi:hypothetical protein